MPSYKLSKANSKTIVPQLLKGNCVVLHHMDGCIHCEMFMPVWKQICAFYNDKSEYLLVSVERGQMVNLPDTMQNVQAFPTLMSYNKGAPRQEFQDARTFDAVSEFIQSYGKMVPTPAAAPKKARAPAAVNKPAAGKKTAPKKTH